MRRIPGPPSPPTRLAVSAAPVAAGAGAPPKAAFNEWLSPGRRRPGDRLPPEQELAATLGISRGTRRAALERIDARGEVVRRRDSDTFVGVARGAARCSAGLELLASYVDVSRALDPSGGLARILPPLARR